MDMCQKCIKNIIESFHQWVNIVAHVKPCEPRKEGVLSSSANGET